jgi:hypothetical protein
VRKQLLEVLSKKDFSKAISSFNYARCIYLLTVYQIEALRALYRPLLCFYSFSLGVDICILLLEFFPPSFGVSIGLIGRQGKIDGEMRVFPSLFSYLADRSLAESDIADPMVALIDEVLLPPPLPFLFLLYFACPPQIDMHVTPPQVVYKYLDRLSRAQNIGPNRELELEKSAQYLILSYLHREVPLPSYLPRKYQEYIQILARYPDVRQPRIRELSDKYIPSMVVQFPQLFWNRQCIGLLLDLLETLARVRVHVVQMPSPLLLTGSGGRRGRLLQGRRVHSGKYRPRPARGDRRAEEAPV